MGDSASAAWLGFRPLAAQFAVMELKVDIERAARIPARLRTAYLDALSEPQELYQENQVRSGDVYLVTTRGEAIGYAVFSNYVLVEFYLEDWTMTRGAEIFNAALASGGASAAICKTFDAGMLTLALCDSAATRTTGELFRRYIDVDYTRDPAIAEAPATRADVDDIAAADDDEFWRDRAEIERYVDAAGLFLFREASGALLGCGLTTRVIEGRDWVDVGMIVAPGHRRRGLGAYIIRCLKAKVVAQGLRPIAGCSVDNVASRRALENAGFVRSHSIVTVDY